MFWIHASRFVESYKHIASECNVPGRDDPNTDVLQLVREWLEARYTCKFVMVIDNVDDRNMFFDELSPSVRALRHYVPQSSRGTTIYTTRNRDVGIDLSLDRDPIIVPAMEVEEARSLLGKRVLAKSTDAEQLELLDELVYLPLAIAQATAFMSKRNKSIFEYLKLYKQSESTRVRLLGQRFNYHGREARPLESVVTTWWISFNYIKEENTRAAELLSIMSFLDYQGVPFSLLIADGEDTFDFEEAMGVLEAFSLVTLDTQRYSCNVHRLVTVAVQGWLTQYENRRNSVSFSALRLVNDQYPDGFFESWPRCRRYLPHAEAALCHTIGMKDTHVLDKRAVLLLKMSTYLRMIGSYEASEHAAEESMHIFTSLFGQDHEYTLDAVASYASTVHKRGRYQTSLALHRQVLTGREKVLGYGHRNTLESLNALGSDLQTLCCYKEAEEIHRKELKYKKVLLDENPSNRGLESDYLIALNNVAKILASQGQLAEAEKLHRESLVKSEALLGRLHPDSFITRGELIGTIRDQGRLEEAEEMYNTLLSDRTNLLGEKHFDTAISLSNLATVKARQKKYEEAEELKKRVYEIQKETLGERHPSTINALHNLACCASDKESYKEAENGFRECLEAQNEILGPSHSHTLNTRRNLADAMRKQEKYDEAETLERATLEICESLTENKEKEVAATLTHIAEGFADQSRWADAEATRRQELSLRVAVEGENSPRAINCLNHLGIALGSQEKNSEVTDVYQRVLEYQSTVLGWDDIETQKTLWNLALAYRNTRQLDLSEPRYKRLYELQCKKHGSDADATLRTLMQLAWVLQQKQDYAESEARYRVLLKSALATMAPGEYRIRDAMTAMNNLASVLKYQDEKSEETATLLRECYSVRRKELGDEHPLARKSLWFLAVHLRDLGRTEESDVLFQRLDGLEALMIGGDGEDMPVVDDGDRSGKDENMQVFDNGDESGEDGMDEQDDDQVDMFARKSNTWPTSHADVLAEGDGRTMQSDSADVHMQ